MGINDGFIKIEKKFAWSFFGFLLALILGVFSIYTVYFKNTNPKLDFIIETNTKVLDLRENVKKLDIFYNNENIKGNGKNLSVIKVRIQNTSTVNILSNFYDYKDLAGFKLENGEIVEKPEISEASNDYIKHNISFNIDSLGNLRFNPIIVEGGEYFVLKILALHKTNDIPTIKPIGKIAGIKTFNVVEAYKTNLSNSFWNNLAQGSFWVHVTRFFAYLIIIVILGGTTITPTVLLSDFFSKKRRKKIVKQYKKLNNSSDSNERNIVFDLYVDNNFDYLTHIQREFVDEKRLKAKLAEYLQLKNRTRDEDMTDVEVTEIVRDEALIGRNILLNSRIITLSIEKIIEIKNNQLKINTLFVEELNKFISFVKLV